MRAVGEDREVARMIGMDVDWVVLTAFVLASTTAGAAGVLYGMQQTVLRPTAGLSLGMFALTGAFLGGIGTVRGAIYGGLLVGLGSRLMDQLGQGGGSDWREVAVFMALVAVLILRPEGLLGSQGYGDR